MAKETYDVLKLIEQNQFCYESAECVDGTTLPEWLKYHPQMEKRQLFRWISELFSVMAQIHRCREHPCYRYVNPYAIIVDENQRLWFLDLSAASNAGQIRRMERRTVRELFLPPEEAYYQRESLALDYYGLGRTIQYLLAQTEASPPLTGREERRFQKLIARCLDWRSEKTFQEYLTLQKQIPGYKDKKKHGTKRTARILISLAALLLLSAGILIYQQWRLSGKLASASQVEAKDEKKESGAGKESSKGEESGKEEKSGGGQENSGETDAQLELGIVYFFELSDYTKSRECFESIAGEDALASLLARIAGVMAGEEMEDSAFRQILQDAKEEADKKVASEEKEEQAEEETSARLAGYYACILRGFQRKGEKEDAKTCIELATVCMESGLWQEDSKKAEFAGAMAASYEQLEEYEDAIRMYREQQKLVAEEGTQIEIYQKLAELYEASGDASQAQQALRDGIGAYPQSPALWMALLQYQISNPDVTRDACMQTAQEAVDTCGKLSEQEDFLKLLKQNGWKIEGGNLCEENE